jgi:hypothetical protein
MNYLSSRLHILEERGKEAESLYSKIDADKDQEGMVIRDIFIRKAAIQKFGDHCDSFKQIVLNSPPLSKEGGLWVDPKPNVVKAWQLLLLQGGNPLCNFEQSLMCDDEKKVCQCKEGEQLLFVKMINIIKLLFFL